MAKAIPVDSGASGTFIAPAGGVVERTPVLIGNALVIPAVSALVGVAFEGYLGGVWEIDKTSGDPIVAGDLVSWAVATATVRRSLTYTELTGDLNGMGIAVAAAGAGTVRCKVWINRGPGNVV